MLVRLVNYVDIISGGTPKTTINEYWDGDIPWLAIDDFKNVNKYVYTAKKSITSKGLENSNTKLLHKNDIIVSARGTVGKLALIHSDMAFNQSCFGIHTKNNNVLNSEYLFYYLKSNLMRILKASQGAIFDSINLDSFRYIEIDIPTIEEQIKISNVLSQIDNQIEINNAMVKRLQVLAHNIFLYYFSNNEKTKIKLNDITEMYQPETIVGNDFTDKGKYYVYGSGGIIGKYDKYNHKDSQIMISCRGKCGNVTLSRPYSWIIGNQMVIKPHDIRLKHYLYNYFQMINLNKIETGSVQKQITRANLKNLDIELVSENVISIISKVLNPIYLQMMNIINNNDELIKIKSKLLPLLINQQFV